MNREIFTDLKKWQSSPHRKPLIITGVRQCGKTYAIREFGRNNFKNMCYINFEKNSQFSAIFDYDFDIKRIMHEIEILSKQKISIGETLLVFDEIQECPRAITSLKYFCEEMQELHLVCAGSLLGVALKQNNISFPVGKVNRIQMFPMSFKEFLMALGHQDFIELFANWPTERVIPDVYARALSDLLWQYYCVGGMPEVVNAYSRGTDFNDVEQIQNEILIGYEDDFSKHAPRPELEKIRMLWDSVPKQLAKDNKKFIFSHVKEGKRAHELEAALQWLKNAGLIYQLQMVPNAEAPLAAYADASFFKVYMCDVGLLSRKLGISYSQVTNQGLELGTFKGAIAENFVMTQLMTLGFTPYFWRSGNTAELDFIVENESKIYPLEVKSATNTQAKSYRAFCSKYSIDKGFKLSLKNIASNEELGTETINLPLYLIWNLLLYLR